MKQLSFKLVDPNAAKKAEAEPTYGRSMWVKISLCAGAMALALILRAAGVGEQRAVSAPQDEKTGDDGETMGDLQYVGTVGASGVLLGLEKWDAPVLSAGLSLEREERLLCFTAAGEKVSCCCAGVVRSVGTDESLGNYVRVAHEGDHETLYYGLNTVLVAPGQEVNEGDTIGQVGYGQTLYLEVLHAGEAQNPVDYVDVGIGG